MKSKLMLALGSVAVVCAAFAIDVHDGEIVPGEWNSDFAGGMAFAEKRHIPLVLFWANPGCGNCAALESACDDAAFVDWQRRRKLVMVFNEGNPTSKDFARNPTGKYPYICVYWPQSATDATTNRFSGVSSEFPVKTDADGRALSLSGMFSASIDKFVGDYVPFDYNGGEFKVGTYAGNRLEIVPGQSTFTDVPFVRQAANAEFATNIVMAVTYPNGEVQRETVRWDAWQTALTNRIVHPQSALKKLSAGQSIRLELLDAQGVAQVESAIAVVENPANCPSNPHWLGEPFSFGEWTMDYDTATNEVAKTIAAGQEAYTLVLYTGALWCPYCKGIEGSLLAPGSAFYGWAKEHNVALVEFDQGRASKPATAAGTLAPRLLTFEPDPSLAMSNTVSGVGYLSRHGVEPEDAGRILALTTHYTVKWLAPESTSARLSQPSLFLVKNDEVVARFTAYRDGNKVYDVTENIGRLNDLLKLADRDGEQDDYRTRTTLSHKVGSTAAADFQISRRTCCFSLQGLSAGRFAVTRTDNGKEPVTFALLQGAKTVATATDGLSAIVSAEAAAAGDFCLKVSAYSSTSVLFFNPAEGKPVETTAFSTSFQSALVLVPEDKAATFTPTTPSVEIDLVGGKDYRLSGFDADSLKEFLTIRDVEHGIYTANGGDAVTAEILTLGGEVSYQAWNPGKVGFAKGAMDEIEGDRTVKVVLRRTGGASGAAVMSVKLDTEASKVEKARYDWQDDVVTWEDGDAEDKELLLTLKDDIVYDGDQTLFFDAAVVSGLEVERSVSRLALTIREDDEPIVGRLAITGAEPGFAAKTTVYATEGTTLALAVERILGAEKDVSASWTITGGATIQSSDVLFWANHDRQPVRRTAFKLPMLASCPSGVVTLTLVPNGLVADPARKVVTVKLTAAAAPAFAESELVCGALVRNVPFETAVGVLNVQAGDRVYVDKVSGVQPAGISFGWDSAASRLVFSGVPTLAGDYAPVYRISVERNGIRIEGLTVRVTMTVVDPTVPAAEGEKAINPSVEVARTFSQLPVVAKSTQQMIGLITVTVPPSGRVSAKYVCAAGTVALSAANWDECRTDGTLVAKPYDRYGEYVATVLVKADGSLEVEMLDPDLAWDEVTASATAADLWSEEKPATDWRGRYTVAFLPLKRLDGDSAVAALGSASFALDMVSDGVCKKGYMRYFGYLPDGTGVSGSIRLRPNGDQAELPIFRVSGTDVFSAILSIDRGAAAAFASKGADDPTVQRVIRSADGVSSVWSHTNRRTEYGDYSYAYEAYGSYYEPGQDLQNALVKTEVSNLLQLTFDSASLYESPVYGKPGKTDSVSMRVDGANVQAAGLSFNPSTGFITGSVTIPFTGQNVHGTYRGVILPGWTGCGCTEGRIDLPFAVGAFTFRDKLLFQPDGGGCSELVGGYIATPIVRGGSLTAETSH